MAIWNTLKGGEDTITKLDDIYQGHLGIGLDTIIACARILLNLGIVFHRCNQMLVSKHPSEYPTLYHSEMPLVIVSQQRNHWMYSLRFLFDESEGEKSVSNYEPFELANFCPSPEEQPV